MAIPMRQGYPNITEAIAGGIEQYEKSKVVCPAQSAHDAKLRHIAASNAMARSNAKHRAMMAELRGKIRVKPLALKDLASLVYPGRKC